MKFKLGLILIFLLLVLPVLANQVIDLSNWGSNFSAISSTPYDFFGYAIAAGDINGDGLEDIIAGAYYADPLQLNAAGIVYVFLGADYASQQINLDLNLENADIQIYGAMSNDQCGKNIAVGDVNNDSFDDIIIASPFADVDELESVGQVYVIFGNDQLQEEYLLQNEEYDVVIKGENPNDYIGISLLVSDINNDSFSDIIIGSPSADHGALINCGKAYVIFGNTNLDSEYDLAAGEQDITIIGEDMNDNSASSLQTGNFNNDQFNDIIIGAAQADPDDRDNAGKIYLIEGKAEFTNSELLLSDSSDLSCTILGSSLEGMIGSTIALGDINGDSNDDIIFSDLAAGNFSGAVNIIYGNDNFPETIDLIETDPNIIISGGASGAVLGKKLFSAKVNMDELDDIIIGNPNANTVNGNSSGLLYIIYGSSYLNDLDLSEEQAPFTILGAAPNDKLGTSFCGLYFNNDEILDLCIGAPEAGNNTGKFFTIYGDLPYLWNRSPNNGETDVEIDEPVAFILADQNEGIDLNSIIINIGGTQYNSSSPEFSYDGITTQYNITVDPLQPFDYSQIVDVTVNCADLNGWMMPPESYAFFTKEDSDPPYTDLWDPAPEELDVPVDTDIIFHVYDQGYGVDLNSVIVIVDSVTYFYGSEGFNYEGGINDYTITITPLEPFTYNQNVVVEINAADLNESPNIMIPFVYDFTCLGDSSSPEIIFWDPAMDDEVARNFPLQVQIIDNETGINFNSIEFYLDEENITELCSITPESESYLIYYQPTPSNYYSYGQHTMRVACEDNGFEPNILDESSSFFCVEDLEPPYTLNHFPPKYAQDVATNTNFSVDIVDDIFGVDLNSISITINGEEIIGTPENSINEIPGGYNIYYEPPERLFGLVTVVINASDLEIPPHNMVPDQYTFTCTYDEDPPFLENLDPEQNELEVPIDSDIYLEVHDLKTGINENTITLLFNNEDVTASCYVSELPTGYSILYNPLGNLDFITNYTLEIECYDNAITPNLLNVVYEFTTVNDIDPPYVTAQDPAENEIMVELDTDIYLEVIDDGMGVNEESIVLMINYQIVTPVITPLEENGFSLYYDPEEDFPFSEIVTVTVFANDNADPVNSLTNYSYIFYCLDDDTDPPFLLGINPAPGTIDVPVNTNISFDILDTDSGVNLNSFSLQINNIPVLEYTYEAISYSDTTGYHIFYSPTPFQYGQIVLVEVFATDLSSSFNELSEIFTFECEFDLSPPEILELQPDPGSSIYPNSSFFFKLIDTQTGIDLNSFYFELDHEPIYNDSLITNLLEDNSFEITYTPSGYLEIMNDIDIYFRIDDQVGNRKDTTYTISIIDDEFNPYVVPVDPLPNSFSLEVNSHMSLEILDKGMGIDESTIDLMINGNSVNDFSLEPALYGFDPDSLGFILNYNFNETYYAGQFINVRVFATDLAYETNIVDTSYSFHLKDDIDNDKVKVIPDIITPNYDGINDECRIWINSNKGLNSIEAKVFDRKGKLVKDLNVYEFENNRYYADWNGNNKNGDSVTSGLYIFQIKISGKSTQGSIVVAK